MLSSAVLGLLHYDHVCCNLCHTQLHKCSNSLKPFTDLKSSNHPLILRSDREGNMLIFNSSSRSHSSNSPPLLFHYSFPLQLHTSSRISSHHIASHHITSHHITSHHIEHHRGSFEPVNEESGPSPQSICGHESCYNH